MRNHKERSGLEQRNMRFDLNKTVEENFEMYQDELDNHPEMYAILKVRYDHFLKSHVLHKKMQDAKDQIKDMESKLKQLEADAKDPKKQSDKAQQFKFI